MNEFDDSDSVGRGPEKSFQSPAAADLPVFPNIIPNKIVKSELHMIEENDIADEKDLQQLLSFLFEFPERHFYYFHEKDRPIGACIARARDCGQLLLNETEFFYYRHPRFQHDYIRITPRQIYSFDWERAAVEKGPMFLRTKLELTSRMRRDMEIQHKIMVEQMIRQTTPENPVLLRPSFMGFGIDLLKVWPWLKTKLRKNKNYVPS